MKPLKNRRNRTKRPDCSGKGDFLRNAGKLFGESPVFRGRGEK